ncbi:MAG: hypothetical protein AABZ78_12740 [Chloroflexota bacterium]
MMSKHPDHHLQDDEESQAYFWSESWQQAEREADEDIRAGRTTRFDSVDDLIADLEQEDS